MKKVMLQLLLVVLVLSSCTVVFAKGITNYKSKYKQQLYVNRGMAATTIMILNWFKNHPEYKRFDSVKSRVNQFYNYLNKAKTAHFKSLASARKKKWKEAYELLKEEWNYLNKIAVTGKKTQDDLMELEDKATGGKNE